MQLLFEGRKGRLLAVLQAHLSLLTHINLYAHDSQLQTILWGRIDYWSNIDMLGPPPTPDATVLLSYATEQMISRQKNIDCEWDFSE